jgi:excisionase family DNA binding protein
MPRTKQQTTQPATVEGLTLAPANMQPDRNQPVIEVLLVTIAQAAQALQVSERTVFNLLDNGSLESVTFGGARRIPIESVRNLARTGASLPTLAERAEKPRRGRPRKNQ